MKFFFQQKFFGHLVIAVALALAAFLPFSVNLFDPFVSDDWDFLQITADRDKPLATYFTTNYQGTRERGSYRPMMNVFWTAHFAVWKFQPFGYHLSTTLLHVGNTLLIYVGVLLSPWFSSERYKRWAGALSAALFALLPNHAEAVAWISAVNDTMVTFFFLLSLLALLLAKRAKRPRRFAWYAVSVGSFTAALLTKEMAITLPAVVGMLVAADELFTRRNELRIAFRDRAWKQVLRNGAALSRKAFAVTLPYVTILAAYFWVRFLSTGVFFGYYSHDVVVSKKVLFLSYASMLMSHLASGEWRTAATLWLYDHVGLSFGVFIAAAAGWIIVTWKRAWSAAPLMGAGVWFVALLPVSSFVIATGRYISDEGERWTYLPSVFFSLTLGLWIAERLVSLSGRPQAQRLMLIGVIGSMALWYGPQLLRKVHTWHQAAAVTGRTVAALVHTMEEHAFDGVVAVGRPEHYRGAMQLRNGLLHAARFTGGRLYDILPVAYTWYDPEQTFTVDRLSPHEFVYRESRQNAFIVSPRTVTSLDYTGVLEETYRERMSGEYVGAAFRLHLSDLFVTANRQQGKKIGILFFHRGEWMVFAL